MKPVLPLLLDTNHLSNLARESNSDASAELLRRLSSGRTTLVVTLVNLLEMSNPAFSSVGEVRALLQDLPHVLANPFEDVQEEEIACACVRAAGSTLSRRSPRVFARDTSEWGYHGGPVGGTAVDMLDAFRTEPSPRNDVLAMAALGANASMMKDNAALIKQPSLPLELAVDRHLQTHRMRYSAYAGGLTAAEVISRAGGDAAFSGYHVQESLTRQRMLDAGQKSTANDVLDEYIAFYAPYCAATIVDRGTFHRVRMSKLACVERMTNDPAKVPAILDRVAAGTLAPEDSS